MYVKVNHTTHYNTGYDCGHCDDDIQIGGRTGFSVSVSLEKNKIKSEYYSINNESFYENAVILENYTFNDKQYERVKIFEKAESNSKLIIARNFGIVGFIDKDGNEWSLLEDNAMQAKPKITNTACE